MTENDRLPFYERMAVAFGFYGRDVSKSMLEVWFETMRPFDLPAVADALNRHVTNPDNGQFPPKPADLVRLIGGGTQDGALVAWSAVQKAVREQGCYRTINFQDPIINAVVTDMGGWISFGMIEQDELPFKAREFENRYRGYRQRGEVEALPALLGIVDRDNMAKGYPASEPVRAIEQRNFIGNAVKRITSKAEGK